MRASIGDGANGASARDHRLMPKYQMEFEGRLRMSRIREIANDSRSARSPIVGIPIVLADGTRMCIKVRRDLLQAACAKAMEAKWDSVANRLVLNGGKSHWKLISMKDAYVGDSAGTRGTLTAWATAQRKRVASKSATPAERKAKRIAHEIGILQRRRGKVYARRPVNPICVAPTIYEYGRENELAWAQGKRTRKELSRVFTAPAIGAIKRVFRADWKPLYAAAAKVLDIKSISERDQHSRITRLTRGPSLTEYIRHPEKHLARMSKPHTRGNDKGRYGQESVESEVETMRRRRMAYLEEMSQLRALDARIENLREIRRAILETETETITEAETPMEGRP